MPYGTLSKNLSRLISTIYVHPSLKYSSNLIIAYFIVLSTIIEIPSFCIPLFVLGISILNNAAACIFSLGFVALFLSSVLSHISWGYWLRLHKFRMLPCRHIFCYIQIRYFYHLVFFEHFWHIPDFFLFAFNHITVRCDASSTNTLQFHILSGLLFETYILNSRFELFSPFRKKFFFSEL